MVTYKKEQRLLQGIADYSLWYYCDESLAINLLIAEAKKTDNPPRLKGQVTAYMREQSTPTQRYVFF